MCETKPSRYFGHGWLDSMAIGLSLLCAVHCLLTPVLLVIFPVIASTFWVERDFHLWMLFFVLPTTCLAVFMGCRKHRDRWILLLSGLGLVCLASVASYEVLTHVPVDVGDAAHCPHCAATEAGDLFTTTTWINVIGGCLLASAHGRNFYLCRRLRCCEKACSLDACC